MPLQDAARQSEREMITGETHWGVRRRLTLVERPGKREVSVRGTRLVIAVPANIDAATRRRALENWYRQELRDQIPELIARWEPKIGRTVASWQIKRMKTKWGSRNREAARLWSNVELAKKDPRCLEYLVVHEMVHLLERGHGERFTAHMDRLLPDWRSRRDQLNGAPLAHEDWERAA